jgi:hypothetical protein
VPDRNDMRYHGQNLTPEVVMSLKELEHTHVWRWLTDRRVLPVAICFLLNSIVLYDAFVYPGGAILRSLPGLVQLVIMLVLLLLCPILYLIDRRQKRPRGGGLARFTLYYGGAVILIYVAAYQVEEWGWYYAINHQEQLVDVIHQFEADLGRPPEDLHELIPDYLPEIPDKAGTISVSYRYEIGPPVQIRYGRQWLLEASIDYGFFDTRSYLYLPTEEYYPNRSFERQVGRWLYQGG